MQAAKPHALILTQTLPSITGLGAAMRLGNWVEALASTHRVTLVVVSMDPQVQPELLTPYWQHLAEKCIVLHVPAATPTGLAATSFGRALQRQPRLLKRWPLENLATALKPLQGLVFDTTLVVRLRLMPVWQMLQAKLKVQARTTCLDLDDIESRAHGRQVRTQGHAHFGRLGYWLERLEARKLARAELAAAALVNCLTICSTQDLETLSLRIDPNRLRVVPNALRLPEQLPATKPGTVFKLLFVGALDYLPNEEAVRWLLGTIWPLIRQALGPQETQLTVVGRNPPTWLQQAAAQSGIALHGNVPDMTPYYLQAHAVLVPLLSGGGTRIKILEAFALGRPVVSTTIGAEGLGIEHQRELLLADDATSFVTQCIGLRRDAALATQLIQSARARVEKDFSLAAFLHHAQEALGTQQPTV
jgi:glycosyltransferase involved in cell wall biosynthesis